MIPVLALVGRPNVGKSTLFNRLTRSRDALVADFPGLTRDRHYGKGEWEGRAFSVIDTGGITGEEDGIDSLMAEQSLAAIDEADAVLFLVDAQDGATATDDFIARRLRQRNKPVFVVVNKIDGHDPDLLAADFYALGFPELHCTAAAHNRGIRSLLEAVLGIFPEVDAEAESAESGTRIAIVGRPNVGKSTLVNRLLGEDRVVVFDLPGTTRDSIRVPYERHGKPYTLIDTAGVRRRKNVKEMVEKFSIVKTLQAIDDANVVVMVFDARENVVDQDLHLLGYAIDAGRALVIAVNKWDNMDADEKDNVKRELDRRLKFINYADTHFISALHGTGVGHLYESIDKAYQCAFQKWSTPFLTRILEDAVSEHQPPLVRGRRIKLRYAHQGGSNPPLVVVHGNQTDDLPNAYRRYLENTFRKVLDIKGTPIRFEFKTGSNPYAGRVNKLTPRQLTKRSRLMKHVKKQKHKAKKKRR